MSAQLLAAGFSCAGPPDHSHRAWCVDAERRLIVGDAVSPAMSWGLKQSPIPGAAKVLICDPHRMLALLDNTAAFRLDVQHGRRPGWRVLGKEIDTVKTKDGGPMLLGAWPLCGGGFALVGRDRRVSTWAPTGRTDLAPVPVPGSERIVGVDAANRVAIFDSGERVAWFGGGWNRLPGLCDSTTSGSVRVRCLRGISLGGERGDFNVDDARDMSEIEARKLLTSGHVALVPIDENAVA